MNPTRARKGRRGHYFMVSPKVSVSQAVLRLILLLVAVCMLWACGGSTSKSSAADSGPLSGNWQFQLTTDNSFASPDQNCAPATTPPTPSFCVGGFLLQKTGTLSGQLAYTITVPSQPGTFCNSGSATVSGTVSGQNVTLTAVAGGQTFSLTGTLTSDGSTMMGTYSSSGQGCGNAQSGVPWSATSVPPLSGAIQGGLHSVSSQVTNLQDRAFPVTGTLSQGPNTGASSATVTGTLNFQNYPCVETASVTGQISGNSVILRLIGLDGSNIGAIGGSATSGTQASFTSTNHGYVIKGTGQFAYEVSTKQCSTGDQGNICLAFGSSNTACTQPISVSPAFLVFPLQLVGSPATSQSISLTNTDPSGATVNGITVTFNAPSGSFNFQPNFTEQDNCPSMPGTPFSLAPQQSCTITISFSPQQGCPLQPSPSACAPFLSASPGSPPYMTGQVVMVTGGSPQSSDGDNTFVVPVSGLGASAVQPSTPELDFGSEAAPMSGNQGEASAPQSVSFINRGNSPVQILPAISNSHCGNPVFSLPLTDSSVPGIQVVNSIDVTGSLTYICDFDLVTGKPNFQISGDSCSGTLLNPLQSCSVTITYAPQEEFPADQLYFLELNTNQCAVSSPDCEIDSGRFPVELRANAASPLRISPAAGLDFGVQLIGDPELYQPMTLKLFNDPNDPNSAIINFTGKVVTGAAFSETDTCGASLAPGSSCTVTVTFTPTSIGFTTGSIMITFNGKVPQTISLRGTGR